MRALLQDITPLLAAFAFTPALASTARAEVPDGTIHYNVSLSTGEAYSFSEGSTFPSFSPTSVQTSASLGATVDGWTISLKDIDSRKSGNGLEIDAGFATSGHTDCFSNDDFGCSMSAAIQDLGDQQTGTFSAGITHDLWHGHPHLNAFGSLTAKTIFGDSDNESTVGVGLTVPYTPIHDGPLTITATGAEVYTFASQRVRPNWGVEVGYDLIRPDTPHHSASLDHPGVSISIGYTSRLTLNPDTHNLEIDRRATAALKFKF